MIHHQLPSGIYGFMHVALMGKWKNIVSEQLDLIHSTGLRRETAKIVAGITGIDIDFDEKYYLDKHNDVKQAVKNRHFKKGLDHFLQYGKNEKRDAHYTDRTQDAIQFLKNRGVDVTYYDSNLKLAEKFTLSHLHKIAHRTSDSKFWYIHTKGVSKDNKNTYYWRKYMEYFIIEKYEECIKCLDEYDICGVDWFPSDIKAFAKAWGSAQMDAIFAGNFWWTRSEYVKKIDLKAMMKGGYYAPEHSFIGTANPKAKSLHNSYTNMYSRPYPPEKYRNSPK